MPDQGLRCHLRVTQVSCCRGPWWHGCCALRLLGLRVGGRTCLKLPEPSPSLPPPFSTPVQKFSPRHEPQFGFLVGEGTRTDINSVTSAYPYPQERPPLSPRATLASCSHGNRPQHRAQSWRRAAAPKSSLGLTQLGLGAQGG